MTVHQILLQEIKDSEVYLSREQEEYDYKRDLIKRIELINWVLENMKKSDVQICSLIESRMNNVVLTINQTHDIIEADKLHSELRILDWIFYQVCKDQHKKFERFI
ncbi:MAG TPA: hypothetical protein VF419_01970 [Nitrososphaeraceae archaeon]